MQPDWYRRLPSRGNLVAPRHERRYRDGNESRWVRLMKILVCVRQVVAPETMPRIDPAAGSLLLDVHSAFHLNKYDAHALEESLQIKETGVNAEITALSLGPKRVTEAIRRALGMGADRSIHLDTGATEPVDPAVAAFSIAAYARRAKFDLILTGVMSEDWQRGAVGPMIAAFLSRPFATAVIAWRWVEDERKIIVERELDGGWREELALPLPALLTVQSGINRPRYPSLSNLLRAQRTTIETMAVPLMAGQVEQSAVVGYESPRRKRTSVILSGTSRQKAARLWQTLREQAVVKE